VILSTRAVPQPKPNILPGGDCGLCCLAGIMGTTVDAAYDYVTKPGAPREALYSTRMRDVARVWNAEQGVSDALPLFGTNALRAWAGRVLPAEAADFDWWPPPEKQAWGTPSWAQSPLWFAAVSWCLQNNYVLMTSIDHHGKGPSLSGDTNHAVLIVGAEEIAEPCSIPDATRIVPLVSISCSVRGLWRLPVQQFLFDYGGFHCHPFKVLHP